MLAGALQSRPIARVLVKPFPFAFNDFAGAGGWAGFAGRRGSGAANDESGGAENPGRDTMPNQLAKLRNEQQETQDIANKTGRDQQGACREYQGAVSQGRHGLSTLVQRRGDLFYDFKALTAEDCHAQ